jgi:hypothetical protein
LVVPIYGYGIGGNRLRYPQAIALRNEMLAEAQQASIKAATLHREKAGLHMETKKCGMNEGWMWLPPGGDHVSNTQKR